MPKKTDESSEIARLKKRIAGLEKARAKWEESGRALTESEQKYKNLVEKAGICILVDDVEGNLVFANKKFHNLLGYKSGEQADRQISEFIHPADRDRVLDCHCRRMAGKRGSTRLSTTKTTSSPALSSDSCRSGRPRGASFPADTGSACGTIPSPRRFFSMISAGAD